MCRERLRWCVKIEDFSTCVNDGVERRQVVVCLEIIDFTFCRVMSYY